MESVLGDAGSVENDKEKLEFARNALESADPFVQESLLEEHVVSAILWMSERSQEHVH